MTSRRTGARNAISFPRREQRCAAAVFFLAGCAPAFAELRIEASAGGIVGDFRELFSSMRKAGEHAAKQFKTGG
jgi:hypothetical protein